ncbi:hypothetical protein [Halocynthiibacter namhaensis]|uniref:hypothetical protein n=1 Tax=Halocynthiibacter namhaensis TaxID=1290553 RepID=UPI0005792502|nr:hypothetical protein [Halocynthiibacter namhaensis]
MDTEERDKGGSDVARQHPTRVLNAGQAAPGLLGFLVQRLRTVVFRARERLFGVNYGAVSKNVAQRHGRSTDPFERLRQDRLR